MAEERKKQPTLTECAWEEINQPGAYVSRETGRLFRIPKEALAPGASSDSSGKPRIRQIRQSV